ncbi:cytochrome C oxidase subunit IV family protein [Rhizobium sp. RU36D]|uniref:cytochrome C oxidase subunit IV family protein n=1 Tax=Rhizobium sp. RU36D TaxID=1907415 RepID=UPI0009D8B050|nr:cytochrome C oxidase subunit IV family protein [Rhizobium sp. RU36D]SMC73381.1 Cytochrome C oxidase subunit IV [Rhizobium sp. RU36D]
MTRRDREELLGILMLLLVLATGSAIVSALAGPTVVPIAAVLLMAFVKSRFVILDFLELRSAHAGLRNAVLAWPVGLLSLALVKWIALAVLG